MEQWLTRDPGSYLWKAARGADWPWDMQAQLVATLIDVTREQTWALSGGGERDRPEPIERPGVARKQDVLTATTLADGSRGAGLDPATIEDPRDWLGWE